MKVYNDYRKVASVILSCTTMEHIDVAYSMVSNFGKLYKPIYGYGLVRELREMITRRRILIESRE